MSKETIDSHSETHPVLENPFGESSVQARWQSRIHEIDNELSGITGQGPHVSGESGRGPIEDRDAVRRKQAEEAVELAVLGNKRFDELNKEKSLLAYLAENLPESEERIASPMDSACEVSIVIPSYAEREYFLRTVDSLVDQQGVSKSQYELIMVVNNPGQEPQRAPNETDADHARKLQLYRKALKENQEVLAILHAINGEGTIPGLNEEERVMMERIKNSGLRVYAIDKSSQGKTLPQEVANVGGARNRGVAEAVARFHELGRNGIIGQSDSDTRFDPQYVKTLIETFRQSPELVGVAGDLEFEAPEDNEFFKTISLYSEAGYVYGRMLQGLIKEESAPYKQHGIKADDIHFSGANMASRAFEAGIVGGVPKIPGGEDPAFGVRLSKIGHVAKVPGLKVVTADRFSARTAVGAGHGQQRLKNAEALEAKKTIDVQSPKLVMARKRIMDGVDKALASKDFSVESLGKILSYEGVTLLDRGDLAILSTRFSEVEDIGALRSDPQMALIGERMMARLAQAIPDISLEEAIAELIGLLGVDEAMKRKYEAIRKDMLLKIEERQRKSHEMADKIVEIYIRNARASLSAEEFAELMKRNKDVLGVDDEVLERIATEEKIVARFLNALNGSRDAKEATTRLERAFGANFDQLKTPIHRRLVDLRAMQQARKERI
jgi:GT2 family glycosyltransferase